MKRNIMRSTLVVILISLFVGLSQAGVLAASTTAVATAPSTTTNTLKVSPLRTDVTIKAGGSAQVSTVVTNLTNTPISVEPFENDFIASPNENGQPFIILDQNQYAPSHSLKKFMLPLPSSVIVPANGSAQVILTLQVPQDAQAGGYFGAVRFAPTTTTGTKSVNLSASVASLILATVPGPTTEKMTLTNYDVQQNGSTGTNFRNPDNLTLLIRFTNQGNIQEEPFGQVNVLKGKKLVYSYNFNQTSPKDSILPSSARRWSIPLSGLGSFGKYTINSSFTYYVNHPQTIDITKTIWIIPNTLIFGVIGGIVLLIVIIVVIRLLLKAYKRSILKNNYNRH